MTNEEQASDSLPDFPLLLGTRFWGGRTPADSALEQAQEFCRLGGRYLDTAPNYCGGRSEEIAGRVARAQWPGHRAYVATKVGLTPEGQPDQRMSAGILRTMEGSLGRLELTGVDLVQLHVPPPRADARAVWRQLRKVVDLGLARRVGVCNHDAADLALAVRCAAEHGLRVSCAQVRYSLCYRAAEDSLFPVASAQRVPVVGWGALDGGGLGAGIGRISHEWAGRSLIEAARRTGLSTAQLALSWALSSGYLTGVVIGVSDTRQLHELVRVREGRMPRSLWRLLGETRDAL